MTHLCDGFAKVAVSLSAPTPPAAALDTEQHGSRIKIARADALAPPPGPEPNPTANRRHHLNRVTATDHRHDAVDWAERPRRDLALAGPTLRVPEPRHRVGAHGRCHLRGSVRRWRGRR